VDHLSAARDARERIWAVRKGEVFRQEAQGIVAKHASRKTPRSRPRKSGTSKQLDLPL